MALTKQRVLQVRRPSLLWMILGFVSVGTLILGVLLLALCFLSLLTSHQDPWLPYVLVTSIFLTVAGYCATVWTRKKVK